MDNFNLKKYLAEGKLLKESSSHKIKVNVYYVNKYEGGGDEFEQEAVPEYEIKNVEDVLAYDEGNHLYIEAGTEGIYEDGMFTTDEGSDTRLEPEYVEKI